MAGLGTGHNLLSLLILVVNLNQPSVSSPDTRLYSTTHAAVRIPLPASERISNTSRVARGEATSSASLI